MKHILVTSFMVIVLIILYPFWLLLKLIVGRNIFDEWSN